ncbi:MAG: hypothetical protein FWE88_08235 [Phycisphaerae bacterium]|nr:hypothetical protein [Phycisphaerae bacterium]
MGLSGIQQDTQFVTSGPTYWRVELRDGSEVFVCDHALKNDGADELIFHSDSLAEARSRPVCKEALWAALILGLVIAGVTLTQVQAWTTTFTYFFGGGGVFIVAGLVGLLGLGSRQFIIDRRQGFIHMPKGNVPMPGLRSGLPLSRVGALQLCYWIKHVRKSRGRRHSLFSADDEAQYRSYRMYELNVILAGGCGGRFVLLSGTDVNELESQAKQLSQMLNVPLINSIARLQTY